MLIDTAYLSANLTSATAAGDGNSTADSDKTLPPPSKVYWHKRCWTRNEVLAELDTIQIYNHLEYYGRERRHEIIRLRHDGECAHLTPSTPALMCGRTPYLRPCTVDALRRVNRCASSKAPMSSASLASAVNLTGSRCAMTSSF